MGCLQKPKIEGSKDDIFGEETKKNRKRTDEGYAIYTEVCVNTDLSRCHC